MLVDIDLRRGWVGSVISLLTLVTFIPVGHTLLYPIKASQHG